MDLSADLQSLSDVSAEPACRHKPFPLLIEPRRPDVDLVAWVASHEDLLDRLICAHGALLFRGFRLESVDTFASFVDTVCSAADWVESLEESVPRTRVHRHVFTSTEYNPNLQLYVHNEYSHVTSWPLYVFFHCRSPATEGGGDTPLADCRAVYQRLPTSIVARFLETGVLYRRNFHRGSAIPWQKAFATDSAEDVERYCRENHMVPQWTKEGLTVLYRRWAALRHPRTHQMVWFNHATVFHPYTLDPKIRNMMLAMGEDRLPYNTYYGDGSPIDEEVIRVLDAAYTEETVRFPWNTGDVLMLDNMSIAHGRLPFRGRREVLVAMKWRVACRDVADRVQYDLPIVRAAPHE